jgi:predicted nucleic acid-binding protein
MKWLLDTNIISFLLRSHAEVRSGYTAARGAGDPRFVLSPVVDYEIRRYLLLKGATRNLAQYEALIAHWDKPPFDEAHWAHAATLWAERHRGGHPIEDADLLIAITALRQDAVLVTNNTDHFKDMGLRLEDWSQP